MLTEVATRRYLHLEMGPEPRADAAMRAERLFYDMATGVFATVTPLPATRGYHVAALLSTGASDTEASARRSS